MTPQDPYIIVYDAGTSSLKGVVYDELGNIVQKRSRFYEFSSPREGWAEIDPAVWWDALIGVTRELQTGGDGSADSVDFSSLKGVALTGQMHSAVLLGDDEKPLASSILWLDRRAAAETAELQEKLQLPPYKLNSSYTLPKLLWLSRHNPELIKQVRTILWPKDYLRFLLTGEKVTDYTEGIGAALLDWETRSWASDRLPLCNLSDSVLPEIVPGERMYPILSIVAEELGLPRECQVLVGSGDIAALLGGAPHRKGRLVYSLGSSSMYFTETGKPGLEGKGLYSLNISGLDLFGGVSSTTGAALNWVYEELWGGEKAIPFREMISQVYKRIKRNNSLLFFPFLAGERSPFWSDEISGSFEGLRLDHGKEHITLAVMEGVAFSIRYILDLMEECGVAIDEIALSAGGAKTPGWPEIIAAVCGKPVAIYNAEETVTTVLFARMAAAMENASFRDRLAAQFPEPKMAEPDREAVKAYSELYKKYRKFLELKLETISPRKER